MPVKTVVGAVAVIGTELTLGLASESNSPYLGLWLGRLGYGVRLVLKLPDDPDLVADQLRQALGCSDFLIITGGLGATHDDVTRAALARLLGKPLIKDEALAAAIGPMAPPGADYESFIRQACLPRGAGAIEPVTGTAPGIIALYRGKVVYALPGVPAEMKTMLPAVAADLRDRFGDRGRRIVKRLKITGAPEPVVARLIDPILKEYPDLTVNILAGPSEIKLAVISEENLEHRVDEAVSQMQAALGRLVYGLGDETVASVVGRLLGDQGLTLGVAESITAGSICSQIAGVPGSSQYLLGGIVAYDNDVKERLLNVPHETLAAKGAVSPETALAMADGVRQALKADLGLAVTGIAGPTGGSSDKPVGLVFVGLSRDQGSDCQEMRFTGDRPVIQSKSAVAAINMLRLFLQSRDRE